MGTVLSGLAIGTALVFGLFLVSGGVLPSAPLIAIAMLAGLFMAWALGPADRVTRPRRGGRNRRASQAEAAQKPVIS
jgi:hypothetical protein